MMENNKNTIDRLLSNDQQNKKKVQITESEDIINDESHVLITAHRVESVRYKAYSFLLIMIGIFMFLTYIKPLYSTYQKTKLNLENIKNQTSIFEKRKQKYLEDKLFITKINEETNNIINYLDSGKGGDKLDPEIEKNLNIAKDYLQLTPINAKKMRVNEKVILANINEYLLRGEGNKRNGDINKIEIGDIEPFELSNVVQLPIILNITFDDEKGLLSFIYNIENKILKDPNFRILYKINEINYNIVDYQKKQDIDISLTAYFIK